MGRERAIMEDELVLEIKCRLRIPNLREYLLFTELIYLLFEVINP